MKVKYWMTKEPVTIGPDEPIAEAARVMKERGEALWRFSVLFSESTA